MNSAVFPTLCAAAVAFSFTVCAPAPPSPGGRPDLPDATSGPGLAPCGPPCELAADCDPGQVCDFAVGRCVPTCDPSEAWACDNKPGDCLGNVCPCDPCRTSPVSPVR